MASLIALSFVGARAAAQGATGSITGTVVDAQKAALVGASPMRIMQASIRLRF